MQASNGSSHQYGQKPNIPFLGSTNRTQLPPACLTPSLTQNQVTSQQDTHEISLGVIGFVIITVTAKFLPCLLESDVGRGRRSETAQFSHAHNRLTHCRQEHLLRPALPGQLSQRARNLVAACATDRCHSLAPVRLIDALHKRY